MKEYKIILFICNWGPHTAFHTLQESGADIPDEIRVIRVPCAGRINRALILKAFEMGADGVAVIGCVPGACRYGTGTVVSDDYIDDMSEVLDLLGLGRERLSYTHSLPDEPGKMLEFLRGFTRKLKNTGPSPVIPRIAREKTGLVNAVKDIARRHDVYACQDCGKCSSACPLTLSGKDFSPRKIAAAAISGDIDSGTFLSDIWSCLTCGICYDRCPSSVNFPEFIRDLREAFLDRTYGAHESHGGFFQSLMRTLSSPELLPRHWDWLPAGIETDPQSKTLYWGGCAPYFDAFFKNFLAVNTRNILSDSLKLLNFFDIRPALLDGERCCGHDLLWSGDRENFEKLARLNIEELRRRGIEEVVTSCPECYRTLS
ncbi:MAG TPA: hydrogenase iron-sulfur subunit, partial [Spirochaetes bacterium]|nr:hydrogenase iron-sulfur subunit [Spirochaetota bacterium]